MLLTFAEFGMFKYEKSEFTTGFKLVSIVADTRFEISRHLSILIDRKQIWLSRESNHQSPIKYSLRFDPRPNEVTSHLVAYLMWLPQAEIISPRVDALSF